MFDALVISRKCQVVQEARRGCHEVKGRAFVPEEWSRKVNPPALSTSFGNIPVTRQSELDCGSVSVLSFGAEREFRVERERDQRGEPNARSGSHRVTRIIDPITIAVSSCLLIYGWVGACLSSSHRRPLPSSEKGCTFWSP